MTLLLFAMIVIAASGFLGLLFGRHSRVGEWLSAWSCAAGSVAGLFGVVRWILLDGDDVIKAPWPLPGGEFHLAIDALSAVFLLPIFLVSLCGTIYGLGYWKQADHPYNARKLRLFYGLLISGMALVVLARNAVHFLFGWECIA
jgi:formate hydrogenlyase subunit 3/multisubunit Na+/H+ antiporter MnhD subunit